MTHTPRHQSWIFLWISFFFFLISYLAHTQYTQISSLSPPIAGNGIIIGQGGGPPERSVSVDPSGPIILQGLVVRVVSDNIFWVGDGTARKILAVRNSSDSNLSPLVLGESVNALGLIKPLPSQTDLFSSWHLSYPDMRLLQNEKNYFSVDQMEVGQPNSSVN